jgi:hypothetical protein
MEKSDRSRWLILALVVLAQLMVVQSNTGSQRRERHPRKTEVLLRLVAIVFR